MDGHRPEHESALRRIESKRTLGDEVGIYEEFGIRPVINAAGPVTRLSGAPLHPEVADAMAEAAQSCVRIDELQEAAGRFLAEASGAEAGYVTAGAAAGLAVGWPRLPSPASTSR